ncbi:MAG: MFS transporter [Firmicutes bacterium]|nr:MFS transporter [Bacillota bacterium]
MNFSIFKNKNYSLFIFGQATSLLGTGFLNVAMALYVLNITGSAGKFSSILALGVIPNIVLGPVAGTIVDKVNRKKMIISMDLLRGIFALILFIYSIYNPISIPIVYVLVIFYSVCQVFFSPAFVTILPSIVKKDELVDANSMQRTISETIFAAAPFLGALFFGLYGLSIILFIDGLTYLISGFSEMFMEVPLLEREKEKIPFVKEVLDGFKVLFIDIRITSLISNGILTHLFLTPFALVGFPYIIVTILGGKSVDYGIVESVATIGSILAVFAVGFFKKKYNIAQCISIGILGMIVFVISMLPLSNQYFINLLQRNSLLIVLFFSITIFIVYISFGFYGVFYVTFYQTTIPKNKLGRYVSVQALFFSLARLLGFKFYGYMLDNFSLIFPIIILGIGMSLKVVVHIPFIKETNKLETVNARK